MKKGLTEIVFILDASGSMYSLTADTIGGFNSLIEKQKSVDGEANISLVTFNEGVQNVYISKPLCEVGDLTNKDYVATGCTALYDAVGFTIANLESRLLDLKEEDRPEKIMIVITTDGEENSSREYNQHAIKNILENKEKEGWEVIFIGANIDTAEEGAKIGLNNMRTANYQASSSGMCMMYDAVSDAVLHVREKGVLNEDWSDSLNIEAQDTESKFKSKFKLKRNN